MPEPATDAQRGDAHWRVNPDNATELLCGSSLADIGADFYWSGHDMNAARGLSEQACALAAAAPDLLSALRQMSSAFGAGLQNGTLTQAMVDDALAALAKAGVRP